MSKENKFQKHENERKNNTISHTSAKEIATKKIKRKMMSMNVDPELYEKFQFITKKLSTNASAVLNSYMYEYVKEHADLL